MSHRRILPHASDNGSKHANGLLLRMTTVHQPLASASSVGLKERTKARDDDDEDMDTSDSNRKQVACIPDEDRGSVMDRRMAVDGGGSVEAPVVASRGWLLGRGASLSVLTDHSRGASEMEMSQEHEELVVVQGEAEEDDGSFRKDATDRGDDDDDDDESFCEYVGTTTRHRVGKGGWSRCGPLMWKRRVGVLLACAAEPPGAGLAARLERLRRSIQRDDVFDYLAPVIKTLGHVLASGVCGTSEALLVDNVLQIVQVNICRGPYDDNQDTDPLHNQWLTILCHCGSSSVSQVSALRMVNHLVARFINCGSDETERLETCLQVQEQTLHAAAEDVQRCAVERAVVEVPHPQYPRGYQEEYQYLSLVQTGISDYGQILTAVKQTESKLLQAKERRKFYEALLDLVLMLQAKLNITEEIMRAYNANGHCGLSFGVKIGLEQYCHDVLCRSAKLHSEDLMSLGDNMESFWLHARPWLSPDIQEMAASTLRHLSQHVPSILCETIRRISRQLSWMPYLTVDPESDEDAGWDVSV